MSGKDNSAFVALPDGKLQSPSFSFEGPPSRRWWHRRPGLPHPALATLQKWLAPCFASRLDADDEAAADA